MSGGLGSFGEMVAAEFLTKKGYKILTTNFRSKFGEIDIVAKDAGTLVFVEVKTRAGSKFGEPEEAVTPLKLSRIRRCAEYYCQVNGCTDMSQKIEVVAIKVDGDKYKLRQFEI